MRSKSGRCFGGIVADFLRHIAIARRTERTSGRWKKAGRQAKPAPIVGTRNRQPQIDMDEHGWERETRIARIFTKQAGNLTAKNTKNMKETEGFITEANEGSGRKTADCQPRMNTDKYGFREICLIRVHRCLSVVKLPLLG
jgi:hypothetical protein